MNGGDEQRVSRSVHRVRFRCVVVCGHCRAIQYICTVCGRCVVAFVFTYNVSVAHSGSDWPRYTQSNAPTRTERTLNECNRERPRIALNSFLFFFCPFSSIYLLVPALHTKWPIKYYVSLWTVITQLGQRVRRIWLNYTTSKSGAATRERMRERERESERGQMDWN